MVPMVFGLAELGRLGRDDEIAHHGQLAAAAERVTGHRRDRGLWACEMCSSPGDEVFEIDVHIALFLHLLDVCTGREGLFAAGDDNAPDRVVRFPCPARPAPNSCIRVDDRALSAFGWFSVITQTFPVRSTRIVS